MRTSSRSLMTHRRVLEPGRHVLIVYAAPCLDQATLGQHAAQILAEMPEAFRGRVLPQQAAISTVKSRRGDGKPVAAVKSGEMFLMRIRKRSSPNAC